MSGFPKFSVRNRTRRKPSRERSAQKPIFWVGEKGGAVVPLSNWRHTEFRFDGDYVHFRMDDEKGTVVYCAVMADYLDARAALARLPAQGCRAFFSIFRSDIEAVASELFDRGIERPIVTPGELYAHIKSIPSQDLAPPSQGSEAPIA
jgi:hypothetical protein